MIIKRKRVIDNFSFNQIGTFFNYIFTFIGVCFFKLFMCCLQNICIYENIFFIINRNYLVVKY